jgi:hypothetical protein
LKSGGVPLVLILSKHGGGVFQRTDGAEMAVVALPARGALAKLLEADERARRERPSLSGGPHRRPRLN